MNGTIHSKKTSNSFTKSWIVKIVVLILAITVITFNSFVSANNNQSYADDNLISTKEINNDISLVKPGKLIIANSPDYPPFSELNGNEIVGFEPDIWDEIAKRIGLEPEIKILNFDTILTSVASGKQVDIGFSGISIDPEREKVVDFSDPYYAADVSFIVTEDSSITKGNSKQKLYDTSLRFAVQSGTTFESYVRENFPKATCLPYSNANDCFSAVMADQADVVCTQSIVATNMLKASYSSMRIVQSVASGDEYGIAISKDNPGLKSAINKALKSMNEDGTMQKIMAKNGINTTSSVASNNLETVKCTAKTNALASNEILTNKQTRITWEGQAAKHETLTELHFMLPENVDYDKNEIYTTMLSGEDLLTRTSIDTSISVDGQNIDIKFINPSQLREGGYYRVEFYGVYFQKGGDFHLKASYTLSNKQSVQITDIPEIDVVQQSDYEKFAESINDAPIVKAWNSNKFCNLFLNPTIFLLSIPTVFYGFLMALAVVLCAFPIALPVGLIFAVMRISRFRIFRGIATTYVNVIRGTPLFLQIYIAFFGLPLAGINIPNFPLGLIVLAMNSSAYMCEIFRAGIQSISKGQFEAARSLGLNRTKSMFYIIIPQAISRCIPTLTSEFILLYKDTSLLASVGVMEVVMFAKTIVATTGSITPYIVAALFYLAITLPLAKIVGNLEGWFSKKHKDTSVKVTKKKQQGIDSSVLKGKKVFPGNIKGSSSQSGEGINPNQMGSV